MRLGVYLHSKPLLCVDYFVLAPHFARIVGNTEWTEV